MSQKHDSTVVNIKTDNKTWLMSKNISVMVIVNKHCFTMVILLCSGGTSR